MRLDVASVDARAQQGVDDAADGYAADDLYADFVNDASNAATALRQLQSQAKAFKPIQQEQTLDDIQYKNYSYCSRCKNKKRKFLDGQAGGRGSCLGVEELICMVVC